MKTSRGVVGVGQVRGTTRLALVVLVKVTKRPLALTRGETGPGGECQTVEPERDPLQRDRVGST